MTNLQNLIISPQADLRAAIAAIDRGARQVALVVDEADRLVAVITDGNIRRGLLRGLSLDAPVSEVMNRTPTTVRIEDGVEAARRLMRERQLHHVPLIDAESRIVDLLWIDDITRAARRTTPVLLMAGGLGMRLRPLTESIPKPMLQIGGRPILEQIIENLADQGFTRFVLSINYLGDIIRDHFRDGSRFGVQIDYVEENERMGTAGSLSLLPQYPKEPMIVMNGDLLTSVRFDALLLFHHETDAVATLCARHYDMQVPYGVIDSDGTRLLGIVEKPVHRHFVNAGVYVLSPEVFDELEPGMPLDMPDLLARLTDRGDTVSVFPLREYWLDIGRIEDLERARQDYHRES
ncbi:nucleotidyltransferase family protein [Hoeflea sp. WL0058]|uniref:Nucleotidyltransferase family protein n=1 Tax=Flavimaribacter sediminis TaxID=2865987 RepID=A0AAE2ZH72_9HYPH|nr:nucleotidyltransferase family protein [Flavimaribacter sediminis]MBW8636206.1 nucleotidyltransferase family protein [Flavimaribacter sediminis]